MKKRIVIIISLVALVSLFGLSQVLIEKEPEVPELVRKAFTAKYPDAQQVEWEEEEKGEFEAEFSLGAKSISANFDSEGTWLNTETEMELSQLPEAVRNAVKDQFPGFEVEESERVEKAGEAIVFEISLENESENTEIKAVFDEGGALLATSTEEGDEDDEGDNE